MRHPGRLYFGLGQVIHRQKGDAARRIRRRPTKLFRTGLVLREESCFPAARSRSEALGVLLGSAYALLVTVSVKFLVTAPVVLPAVMAMVWVPSLTVLWVACAGFLMPGIRCSAAVTKRRRHHNSLAVKWRHGPQRSVPRA